MSAIHHCWEERYRDIIATGHVQEGIVLHDVNGNIVFSNESATRILGVPVEQMQGAIPWHSPWRMIHEDGTPFPSHDLPTVVTLRTSIAQSNVIMGIVRGNGTVSWITTNCTPLTHAETDAPYGVVTSFIDITEWKRTKDALRESEERARQALAITALLALSFDAKETLAQITRQGALLLRADVCAVRLIEGTVLTIAAAYGTETAALQEATITVDDRISQVVCRLAGPVAIPSSGDLLPDALAALIEPTGYRAYLGVPLHSESENMLGVLELYAADERAWTEPDVDLLKTLATAAAVALRNNQLYEEARRERERSEAIIAEIGDGIYQTDAHGVIAVWNPAAEMITGFAAGDVIGRNIADVLVREKQVSTLHSIGRTLLHTHARTDEDLWLDILIAPLHDHRNQVAGIVATFRDHTAERELDQLKSDFVSTVSHELRTQLTSIYGFAKTLVRTDAVFSPADQRTFLEVIATQAEHVTELVNDLLSVTRLEAGQFKLNLAPCDLREAVPEAVESVRNMYPPMVPEIAFLDASSP